MPLWIVRHAQSRSNSGQPTIGPDDNTLSDLGYTQAQCVAQAIHQSPDLIVTSPYVRTQLTAQPLMAKFPDVPVEVWPVQEFTYLSLPLDQPTNRFQRTPLRQAYWNRFDPDYVDGERAESFVQLMARAQGALTQCQQQSGFVVIFTHGLFIKAMMWQTLAQPATIDSMAMQRFYGFWKAFRVPNASILHLDFQAGRPYWSAFAVDHLPVE